MSQAALGDQALTDKIFAKKLRLLAGRAPFTIVSNLLNGAIVALLCGPCLQDPLSWAWLGFMAVLVALRVHQVRLFKKDPNRHTAHQWARYFVTGSVLMGTAWGVGIVFFGISVEFHYVAMIAFLVSGMTAGSVAIGCAHRPMSTAFSIPILVAMMVVLISRQTFDGYVLAFAFLLFSAVMYMILNFLSNEVDISIRHAIENEALANDLREALLREENARAAQTQLVANVSHELRTPLSAVTGMIDLAMTSNDETNRKHFLTIARDSSDALLVMLDDLLEVSRLDLGRLELKSEPMSPSVLAQSVGDLLRDKASKAGVALKVETDWPSDAAIMGDNNRVRQILVNLVGNAIKFTDQGQIALHVTTKRHEGVVKAVEFKVEDTGCGIKPADQERIFERFQQAESGHTRTRQGTGLGLAISKELAETMGGTLRVESEIGVGSTFIFHLPCDVITSSQADVEDAETAHQDHPLSKGEPVEEEKDKSETMGELLHLDTEPVAYERNEQPIHALVVDDNEINCVLITAMLGQAGVQYEIANDGQEALNRLSHDGEPKFDVILMDVQMPQMDGLEATRRIRAMDNRYKDTPVIAVTANAFKEQCEQCAQAGMQGFVVKPIDADKLIEEVQRVLKGPSLGQLVCTG